MARNHEAVSNESLLRSQATVGAGFVFAALTLSFLMWLVIVIDQIQCSKAALIALVFGFGAALSTSFIGGYVAATGPVAFPYLGNRPINIALGGGILALVMATAMAWFVVTKNCVQLVSGCDVALPSVQRVLSCAQVYNLIPPPKGEGFLAVRLGPDTTCAQKFSLLNKDKVEIISARPPWYYVRKLSDARIAEGKRKPSEGAVQGWVYGGYIEETQCQGSAP